MKFETIKKVARNLKDRIFSRSINEFKKHLVFEYNYPEGRLEMLSGTTLLGFAEFRNKGTGLIEVEQIYVLPKYIGYKFGTRLVKGVNNFLDEKQKNGELINAIVEPAKKDLYERNGWHLQNNGKMFRKYIKK